MQATLEKFGWEYEICGLGQPWKGFRHKMELVKEAVQQQLPNRLMVVVDVYDAFCVRGPEDFVEAFQSFDANIVIGTETLCHWSGVNCVKLDDTYWDDPNNRYIGKDVCGHKYVNGGFVCGYAAALVKVYSWMLRDPKLKDDQRGIGQYISHAYQGLIEDPCRIELDAKQCLVVNDGNDHIKPNKVTYQFVASDRLQTTYKTNVSQPWFVHVPGCLMLPSVYEGVRVTNALMPLTSYDLVGKMVLGDNFVQIRMTDKGATRIVNTVLWSILLLVVLLLLWLFICYIRLKRKQ